MRRCLIVLVKRYSGKLSVKEGKVMTEKTYVTPLGTIHYWVNIVDAEKPTLVFLPGLTADHRLFEKQIEYFEGRYNVFVWDAPGHAASWPFEFDFDLADKAKWLDEILAMENITSPVIAGQSMGGYVGQMYSQLYPEKLKGFISIDSAPLQRKYVTSMEIWLLKRMEPVYYYYPWKSLLKTGTNSVAVSTYGRKLMYEIMMTYDGDKKRYAKISGHGMKILAEAMEKDLSYEIKCPALLICGEKDMAGSCIRYNKAWNKETNIPIAWIKNAGHNSNTDKPEEVNVLIEKLVSNKIEV
jgi:pimeloyl-ACP methyl ester carboxylesterase